MPAISIFPTKQKLRTLTTCLSCKRLTVRLKGIFIAKWIYPIAILLPQIVPSSLPSIRLYGIYAMILHGSLKVFSSLNALYIPSFKLSSCRPKLGIERCKGNSKASPASNWISSCQVVKWLSTRLFCLSHSTHSF